MTVNRLLRYRSRAVTAPPQNYRKQALHKGQVNRGVLASATRPPTEQGCGKIVIGDLSVSGINRRPFPLLVERQVDRRDVERVSEPVRSARQ